MGPLSGIRILEMASIGPGPMAAMMLSDMGATVLRIERQSDSGLGIRRPTKYDLLLRGRKAIALDLKKADAIEVVLGLVEKSDGLIEGFRPGVMERLGLSPDICHQRNPKLIFGRMTGWGQQGPLSHAAGHDLNYIGLTGALNAFGRKGQMPVPPSNVLGDFAGGATYLAFGMVCALLEAQRSGKGQVIDAAIIDGTAHLMTSIFGAYGAGIIVLDRGQNITDTGAFFYEIYACSDDKLISIAPIEAKFYSDLLEKLGIDPNSLPPQSDKSRWEEGKATLAQIFARKTRDEWCAILEGSDVCFAPVLSMEEAPHHPHMHARGVFIDVDGVVQPAPAPRFSRTIPQDPSAPKKVVDTPLSEALYGWMDRDQIERLRASGLTIQP